MERHEQLETLNAILGNAEVTPKKRISNSALVTTQPSWTQ
jgi:hypothetical protein